MRRTFTDGNLSAINTDADRFMKVEPNAGGAAVAGQTISAAGQPLAPLTPKVNQFAVPVLTAPDSVLFTLAGQTLPDQRDSVLQGSSGRDVLIGSLGNDLVLGGQGRDVLVGGFGHTGVESACDGEVATADLDAHAEALWQVVAERSAAGSLPRLDGSRDVAGTAGLGEQAEVDVWVIPISNPHGFLFGWPE